MMTRTLILVGYCLSRFAISQVSTTVPSTTTQQQLFSVYSESFASDTWYNANDGYEYFKNQSFNLQYDYTQHNANGRLLHFNVTTVPDGNGTAMRISANSADKPHTSSSNTDPRAELRSVSLALFPRTNYTITWDMYLAELQSPNVTFCFAQMFGCDASFAALTPNIMIGWRGKGFNIGTKSFPGNISNIIGRWARWRVESNLAEAGYLRFYLDNTLIGGVSGNLLGNSTGNISQYAWKQGIYYYPEVNASWNATTTYFLRNLVFSSSTPVSSKPIATTTTTKQTTTRTKLPVSSSSATTSTTQLVVNTTVAAPKKDQMTAISFVGTHGSKPNAMIITFGYLLVAITIGGSSL